MRRPIYIPQPVVEAIRAHVSTAVSRAREDGFLSAAEDEDTMTGHLGALLQISDQSVTLPQDEISGEWRWSIRYNKFRGRGPRATESFLGADGILEFRLESGNRVDRKALLFQAKMGTGQSRDLLQQSLKLSTWREAAAVWAYAEAQFTAYDIDEVVGSRGRLSKARGSSLDAYLAERFLPCSVGDDELRYDAHRRELIWRAMNGEMIATAFQLGHRIAIKVEATRHETESPVDRRVDPDDIYRYRMSATADEILDRQSRDRPQSLAKAQRDVLSVYHPDKFADLDPEYVKLATKRAQEIGEAAGKLRRQR